MALSKLMCICLFASSAACVDVWCVWIAVAWSYVSCRVQKHACYEQQVATYMLGNLDGEEREGWVTASQVACLSAALSVTHNLGQRSGTVISKLELPSRLALQRALEPWQQPSATNFEAAQLVSQIRASDTLRSPNGQKPRQDSSSGSAALAFSDRIWALVGKLEKFPRSTYPSCCLFEFFSFSAPTPVWNF